MTTAQRWRAFSLLAVAFFVTIADLAIVNVALPTIGSDLHFSESNLQWVVTAYGLTFGGFLLLGGRAADLLGRRRIFMVGLAVFTAASLGCGLATTDWALIALRGVQGVGAAIILPAALSIVMNIFPEGPERNKALGLWGAVGASGATVGVLAGGLLTRYVGWEYIFFLNVPIGVVALSLTRRVVPESRLGTERQAFRPVRCADRHRRLAATGVRDLERSERRLGDHSHDFAARGLGEPARFVHRDRDEGRSTADAAAHLPPQDPRRRERGRLPARCELLRLHLHRHPLHAAGARLLGAANRARLAGDVGHLGRVRRRLAETRHARLAEARDGSWHGADRDRAALDDSGRGRARTGAASSGRSSSPGWGRRSRSSPSRSPHSPEWSTARPASPRAC